MKARINAPITYYGGKKQMVPHILPLIPNHKTYTESFLGGGAVFFAKEPSELEIINDVNKSVINFYRETQSNFDGLKRMIDGSLHSRQAYNEAKVIYELPDLFEPKVRAWAFWILTNQGFAGKIGSWGYDKKPPGKVSRTINNKKLSFDQSLVSRLERTQIECTDALKVITNRDSPDTFHYIDPPYVGTNLGHYGGYNEQHYEELLTLCSRLEGKFMLSNFPGDQLSDHISKNKWEVKSFDKPLSASPKKEKKARKVEVLVMNY